MQVRFDTLSSRTHQMRTQRITGSAGALLLLLGSACGDDSPLPEEAAHKTKSATGDLSELAGDFAVRLTASNPATGASARTSVFGVVKDGLDPSPIQWHVTQEDGDCTLLEPEAPFCATPCGGEAVCTAQDECTPYAKAREVGTVQLRGLGDRVLSMEPVAGKYMPAGASLPYPPCDEGSSVRLKADGDDYPAFSLEASCIEPLEFETAAKLEAGQDLELTWGEPGERDLARIQVKIDISHHGGAKGKIECDTADDGSITIASAMIDRLVELGVAGFPTISLTRVARSSSEDEPRAVTLSVVESVERPVDVPGVTSCTDDKQCPAGQRCATSLVCRAD
jgi:hypothetical protein